MASNRAVKTKIYSTWSIAGMAITGLLQAGVVHAQIASNPPSSAMVPPKTEKAEGIAIEPKKPAPDEEGPEDVDITVDPASLLPELTPVPRANATLVGGTVERLDRIRDRVTVRVFGGGKETFLYDPRTQVYRAGKSVTITDLKEGERIYLDTILDGNTVFAQTIRLSGSSATGQSQGTVLKYRADKSELILRDALSPEPIHVRLNSATQFKQGDRQVAANTLVPGALISISFNAEGEGKNTAREIAILAVPGTHYAFAGQVVHIDLRTGLLVLNSSTDRKTYEVYLDPSVAPDDNLHPGSVVTVQANFEGSRYVAHSLTIDSQ